MTASRIGILYIFAAVVGYSFLPVFTDHLLNGGVEPLEIALWRYAIAAPAFWLVSLVLPIGDAVLPRARLAIVMGPLMGIAGVVAFFGLQILPAGTYVVIFYTYPAIVAILSLFLGERLVVWGWIALGMTLIGIALTAPDFSDGLQGENFSGVLLALINALAVAIYYILSGRWLRNKASTVSLVVRASAWTVTGSLLSLIITALIVGADVPQGIDMWLNLLGMAVISTVMPIFALNAGIQKLGATQAAIFGTIEPLVTAFFALLFLGQAMLPAQWIGGLVIVASVILLQTMGTRRKAPLEPLVGQL